MSRVGLCWRACLGFTSDCGGSVSAARLELEPASPRAPPARVRCRRMSARRDAISPARRADASTTVRAPVIDIDDEETACPVCGINLLDVPALEAERHARGCALALSQLDAETLEDGNDELEDDELEDAFAAVVDEIDRKRALEAAAQSLRETTRPTTDRAIKSTETVEMWLRRIGMSAYFQPLYVKEDLLDVVDARECSAEDLVSVGVDAEHARALAFCGGAPPKWCSSRPSSDRVVTRARSVIARARGAAASNVERLWDVARGAENRGRGESLPSIDRLKRR